MVAQVVAEVAGGRLPGPLLQDRIPELVRQVDLVAKQ
jgi:hypothetical protein